MPPCGVKTLEAVEKVGVVPINDLESSSEQPKIGMSGVRSGIRNRFEGVFQQAVYPYSIS
jgi:hypothetical protein